MGEGNFSYGRASLFAEQGLLTLVVDAPSDAEAPISRLPQTPEHVADINAVIAWARSRRTSLCGWSARVAARNRPRSSPRS